MTDKLLLSGGEPLAFLGGLFIGLFFSCLMMFLLGHFIYGISLGGMAVAVLLGLIVTLISRPLVDNKAP